MTFVLITSCFASENGNNNNDNNNNNINNNNVVTAIESTIHIGIDTSLNIIVKPSIPSTPFQHVLITVPPRTPRSLSYTSISLQLHTQSQTLVTSFTPIYVYSKTCNSTDSSVFYLLSPSDNFLNGYIGSNATLAAPSLLVVVANKGPAPVPGG